MSYIRPLSNPESLYIIGTANGDVEFMGVPDWGGSRRPDLSLFMPAKIFEKLLLRFLNEREEVSYEGATLFQLSQEKLGLPPIDLKDPNTWATQDKNPDLYKWRLRYPERWEEDEGVNAWEVTWCHIAQSCKRRRGEKPWYEEVKATAK
jgi:hypothetical protein